MLARIEGDGVDDRLDSRTWDPDLDGHRECDNRSERQRVHRMRRTVVDDHLLDEVVRRLVNAIDPDRIILFGSRARGDAKPDSDIDLLIVKETTEPIYRRAIPAYRALSGIGVPKDVICRTPAEIEDWSQVPTYITTRALKEGKILYEKRS
jgi:predicted nucleotidyltransferase